MITKRFPQHPKSQHGTGWVVRSVCMRGIGIRTRVKMSDDFIAFKTYAN